MFGVLKGAGCAMKPEEKKAWMGHICGLCLALRDNAGHASRITTNYDAALLSVLCEAQVPATVSETQKYSSRCPLRSNYKADVTAPDSAAAQYAASIALIMSATKIDDHLEDKETFLQHMPTLSSKLADRWRQVGQNLAGQLGFESQAIQTQTTHQTSVEAEADKDFYFYARPTELAVGAAFQHTAAIANVPQNGDILYQMGRLFGRIMYLLDSYEDYAADIAANRFNALAISFEENEIQRKVRHIFRQAYNELKSNFEQLTLAQPHLAHKLLIQQLKRRSYKVLDISTCVSCSPNLSTATADANTASTGLRGLLGKIPVLERRRHRRHRRRGCGFGFCEALICCDCLTDCCCCGCCDFDICEVDGDGCEICDCDICCCDCGGCECD